MQNCIRPTGSLQKIPDWNSDHFLAESFFPIFRALSVRISRPLSPFALTNYSGEAVSSSSDESRRLFFARLDNSEVVDPSLAQLSEEMTTNVFLNTRKAEIGYAGAMENWFHFKRDLPTPLPFGFLFIFPPNVMGFSACARIFGEILCPKSASQMGAAERKGE